jgi:NitT/TauT family transport system substrate-binding protein
VLSEVTVYNELNQIRSQGYDGDKLQVLSPKDYNSAIVGDMIFTTEKFINAHPQELKDFLSASMKGWQYCFQHPDEAVDIILKYNPELKRDEQKQQLMAVLKLISSGDAPSKGMGFMNPSDYATADRILFDSGQIKSHVDPNSVFDASIWQKLKPEEVAIPATPK